MFYRNNRTVKFTKLEKIKSRPEAKNEECHVNEDTLERCLLSNDIKSVKAEPRSISQSILQTNSLLTSTTHCAGCTN